MMFYERFRTLCAARGVSIYRVCKDTDTNKGSVQYWRKKFDEGVDVNPGSETLGKLADYLDTTIDYLTGRTDSPDPQDADPDPAADIPLSYMEAAGGDVKKARAIMLAAERDAQQEAAQPALAGKFSPADAILIYALWGDAEGIDAEDLADVRKYAEYVKEKKNR